MGNNLHMKKLHILTLIPAFCGISLLSAQQQLNERPNILLILSDDHSYPYLGCYGNPDLKTPNIDGLAANGIQYHHAYTSASQSVPSRASLMTGRNVLDVEMSRFSAPLQRQFIAFPEILRDNGYYTGICGRSYHLDGSNAKADATVKTFEKYHLQTFNNRVDFLRVAYSDDEAVDQYNEFLSSLPTNKPFFIQVNFHDPHRKWDAVSYEPDPDKISVPEDMPDTKELRKDLAAHYGEIMRLDENVGRLLSALKKHDVENTMIIFMGDNGSAVLRGKGTLYRAGIHVPLIVQWKKNIKPGLVSRSLISGEDLAPTIIEAAKAKIPAEMTGKSFYKTFYQPDYEVREHAFAVRVAHGSGLPQNSAQFDLIRTVLNKDYKLIYHVLWQLPYVPVDFGGSGLWKGLKKLHHEGQLAPEFSKMFFSETRNMFEFYDLKNDPYEMNNLSGDAAYKQQLKSYKELLQEWMILYQDYCPLPITPGN